MSTKPIPPKTAAKLAEAEQYLRDMREANESSDTFRRQVADFLTAARSVKDVLINDIAGGDPAVKDAIKRPITNAMNADLEMASMVKTRNQHTHEGDFSLTIQWVPERPPQSSVDAGMKAFLLRQSFQRRRVQDAHHPRGTGMSQAVVPVPRAFFTGIPDRDAYAVCVQHLGKVVKAADECVQLYG